MKQLTHAMLSEEEKRTLEFLAKMTKPIEQETGKQFDKFEGIATLGRALYGLTLWTVQATEKLTAKGYLQYLRSRYGCDGIDTVSFSNYPKDLFVF